MHDHHAAVEPEWRRRWTPIAPIRALIIRINSVEISPLGRHFAGDHHTPSKLQLTEVHIVVRMRRREWEIGRDIRALPRFQRDRRRRTDHRRREPDQFSSAQFQCGWVEINLLRPVVVQPKPNLHRWRNRVLGIVVSHADDRRLGRDGRSRLRRIGRHIRQRRPRNIRKIPNILGAPRNQREQQSNPNAIPASQCHGADYNTVTFPAQSGIPPAPTLPAEAQDHDGRFLLVLIASQVR